MWAMTLIATLTLSPAVDVSTAVDVVTPEHKLRCDPARIEAGGGGVNVARVAGRLGADTLAVLPLGGPNGERLRLRLEDEGVSFRSIDVGSETRQSFSVTERSTGQQFRFVVPGAALSADDVTACFDATVEAAKGARCLVISGSSPEGVPDGFFTRLIEACPGVDVLVDTSGAALHELIAAPTRLVKPSARELSAVVGRDLVTEAEIEEAATEVMTTAGCRAIVVSIGAGGAIVVDDALEVRRYRAPSVRVVSTVGAGDSMVGGIATVLAQGGELHDAVMIGIAAGTATVVSPGSQLCDPATVAQMLTMVRWDHPSGA